MQILAHRGYWKKDDEKNSMIAFERAFNFNYGIETDIRDFNGKLVISHNVPDENSILFNDFLDLYKKIGNDLPLALNIKSDGLQDLLFESLNNYSVTNYFVFDMSIPEQVVYVNKNFKTFSRQSEFELSPTMYDKSLGVWMDEFELEWINSDIINSHLSNGKLVGVISSEIHKHSKERIWNILNSLNNHSNVLLCTDIPKEAEVYFNVKN